MLLLESGIEPNTTNGNGNTPVHLAVITHQMALLPVLCKKGANINATNKKGETALFIAVGEQKLATVQVLLELNADTSIANKEGLTPLMLAAKNRNFLLCKLLLSKDADVNAVDNKGNSALHHSIIKGCLENLEAILEANPRLTLNQAGESPLSLLIKNQRVMRTISYINHLITTNQLSALTGICLSGKTATELYKSTSNLTGCQQQVLYIIQYCIRNKEQIFTKRILLQDIPSIQVQLAHIQGISKKVIEWAIKGIANESIRQQPFTQFNKLLVGITADGSDSERESFRFMLNNGGDINAFNPNGLSIIQVAVLYNRPKQLKLILDQKPQVDTVTAAYRKAKNKITYSENSPALIICAKKGTLECAKLIIDYYPKGIDIKDKNGWTALQHAAKHGHNEIAILLVNSGACLEVPDDVLTSPVLLSAKRINPPLTHFLLQNTELTEELADQLTKQFIQNNDLSTLCYCFTKMPYLFFVNADLIAMAIATNNSAIVQILVNKAISDSSGSSKHKLNSAEVAHLSAISAGLKSGEVRQLIQNLVAILSVKSDEYSVQELTAHKMPDATTNREPVSPEQIELNVFERTDEPEHTQ
nr:ankyrin repeat domain-containing protein [Parashewanella hymeniacidonis]